MKTRLLVAGILAWGLALPGLAAGHADVPLADNLQVVAKDAQSRKVPIMLLFASAYCSYCDRAKAEYLGPMVDDPAYRDKVIIRQIEVGSGLTLVNFDGTKTTHDDYAASQKIAMVPTIKVVDPHGKELSKPVVGFIIPDFYLGYIEAAIEEGLEKMRAKN